MKGKILRYFTIVFFSLCFSMGGYSNTEVMTKKQLEKMTPDMALEKLKLGNQRFYVGKNFKRSYVNQIKATASGQFPYAAIVSCLDSRVPPEIIFDTNIGDIFVGRIAGNFVDYEMIGSLEFATAVSGAKLIVVLGHTDCGAVKGACDHVNLGFLTTTLSKITPAVLEVQGDFSPRTSENNEFVHAVTEKNVRLNVKKITTKSKIIRDLVEQKKVKIVGAMYDISTGKVTFY